MKAGLSGGFSCLRPVSPCCLRRSSSPRGAPPRRILSSLFRPLRIRWRATRPRSTWRAYGRLAATQRLVTAAETGATAAQGLRALRDEYIFVLNDTLENARTAGTQLLDKQELALLEIVDCLAAIGDTETVEALGSPGLRCRAGQGRFRRAPSTRPRHPAAAAALPGCPCRCKGPKRRPRSTGAGGLPGRRCHIHRLRFAKPR